MAKRDWQKDWELCQAATSGPWKVDGDAQTWDEELNEYASSWVETPNGTWRQERANFTGIEMVQQEADARFIAEAREALPYWLQRVRKLEAVVKAARELREFERNPYKLGPKRGAWFVLQTLQSFLDQALDALNEKDEVENEG